MNCKVAWCTARASPDSLYCEVHKRYPSYRPPAPETYDPEEIDRRRPSTKKERTLWDS